MADFTKRGFYATKGGWKAEVIHVADGKLVVRHYGCDSEASLKKDDLSIHDIDGSLSGIPEIGLGRLHDMEAEWSDSPSCTDVLQISYSENRRPSFSLEKEGYRRIGPEATGPRFRIKWDAATPDQLSVERVE